MRRGSFVLCALAVFISAAASSVSALWRDLAAPQFLPASPAEAVRGPPPASAALDRARLAELTRLGRPPCGPEARPAMGECSAHHRVLLGTLLSLRDAESSALVETRPRGPARTLRVGAEWNGALVLRIDRDRVSVRRADAVECLEPRGQAEGAPQSTALPAPGRGVVRATSPGWFEVPRAELDAARSQLVRLASQVLVVPAFENGLPLGFRVARVAPGSFVSQLGIQPGDVLQRVNGADVTDTDGLLRLYGQLDSLSNIEVQLLRNGVRVQQRYRVL